MCWCGCCAGEGRGMHPKSCTHVLGRLLWSVLGGRAGGERRLHTPCAYLTPFRHEQYFHSSLLLLFTEGLERAPGHSLQASCPW